MQVGRMELCLVLPRNHYLMEANYFTVTKCSFGSKAMKSDASCVRNDHLNWRLDIRKVDVILAVLHADVQVILILLCSIVTIDYRRHAGNSNTKLRQQYLYVM
uniref:Uncharacterized protein n=1 Tax=Opuntia streptacantha TaxID=393608 RepID=A0A7C8YDA1_OPUST